MKDDAEAIWNERVTALEALLGKSKNVVHHSVVPFYLGGDADVLEFHGYIDGVTYVTSDLTGSEDQAKGDLANYELMICTRHPNDWAPNIISRLARYTLETPLNPGETMDIGPAVPEGSTIVAFLYATPDLKHSSFKVRGRESGLLLCIGITAEELEVCHERGSDEVLQTLRQNNVFPFTILKRESVF